MSAEHVESQSTEPQSWTELGKEMWSYLTGRGAAINYKLIDMIVEVPRDTGADAPRAVWRLDGTLQITTTDNEYSGAAESHQP